MSDWQLDHLSPYWWSRKAVTLSTIQETGHPIKDPGNLSPCQTSVPSGGEKCKGTLSRYQHLPETDAQCEAAPTWKTWLMLSLRTESSGESTGVWRVNLVSNWLVSSSLVWNTEQHHFKAIQFTTIKKAVINTKKGYITVINNYTVETDRWLIFSAQWTIAVISMWSECPVLFHTIVLCDTGLHHYKNCPYNSNIYLEHSSPAL